MGRAATAPAGAEYADPGSGSARPRAATRICSAGDPVNSADPDTLMAKPDPKNPNGWRFDIRAGRRRGDRVLDALRVRRQVPALKMPDTEKRKASGLS
jgi:hypothetical protein